jgi:hypothetical protein
MCVAASRLHFALAFTDAAPFWDEWDAIFDSMLMPLARGDFHWTSLFSAHNEHRILFTRLIALALVKANDGQFDGRVECIFNILLAAAAAWAFLSATVRHIPIASRGAFVCMSAVALALPYGWENIIGGFQSQFSLLIAFSVVCVGVASVSTLGLRGILGLAFLTSCAMFSMASGVLAAISIVGIVFFRRIDGTVTPRAATLTIASQLTLAVTGFALIPHTNADVNHATGLGELIPALRILFSWPMRPHWSSAIVLWIPSVLLVGVVLREVFARRPLSTAIHLLLGLLIWIGLQMAAMAYSRGHGMTDIAPRYLDIIVLGVLTNVAILLHLAGALARARRLPIVVVIALYCGWIMHALLGTYDPAVRGMTDRHATAVRTSEMMRAYLATGDRKVFARQPGTFAYPETPRIMRALDDPAFADLMPATIRRPIPLGWQACTGFVPGGAYSAMTPMDGAPTLGSFAPGTANATVAKCQSKAFATRTPYVSVWMSGYPMHRGDVDIQLVDAAGHNRSLAPSTVPRESWVQVTARVRGPQTLKAYDDDATTWVAFSNPIETGRLTAAVARMESSQSNWLVWAIVLAIALLLAVSLLPERPNAQ